MHRPPRFALLASFLLLFLALSPSAIAGGAVLTPLDSPPLATVDLRMAVSVGPNGSTRWNELTLPASTRALWLVPVRPGATIDWVSNRWLDALDDATRPRIFRPSSTTTCSLRQMPETAPLWTFVTSNEHTSTGTVESSAEAVLFYASTHGYRTTAAFRRALGDLFASGWRVLMVDVTADAQATAFGTVRVSDKGGAVVPLAVSSGMRLTTFTIGKGPSSILGGDEIDPSEITWGVLASNYSALRREILSSSTHEAWLRETYSHDAIFDGAPFGAARTPSLVEAYFLNPSCRPNATAPCGDQTDLALALTGVSEERAVVTRWLASIPEGTFGSNTALGFEAAASHGPVISAGSYERCEDTPSYSPPSAGSSAGSPSTTSDDSAYVVSEGCGSSSGPTIPVEDPPPPSESSSEGCSGGGEDTEGWDSDDSEDSEDSDGWDSDDSDDSCSGSDDSSSSSDSCSGSTSTGDGWDTEDEASPQSKKTHAARHPPRKRSPASRYALLAVAILLPFRRRARPT